MEPRWSILVLCFHAIAGARAMAGGSVAARSFRAVPRARALAALEWEDCEGCQLLRPDGRPTCVVHFLGDALVSPSPNVAYRHLLESLARRGYAVLATPYTADLDLTKPASQIHSRFSAARSKLDEEPWARALSQLPSSIHARIPGRRLVAVWATVDVQNEEWRARLRGPAPMRIARVCGTLL